MSALQAAAVFVAPPPREIAPAEQGRFPCSLAQQRFWVLEQLDPGNPSLNVAVRWRLEGELWHPDLEEAWRHIMARHHVLRTWFERAGDEPVQVVEAQLGFRIPIVDLTKLPEPEAIAEAERLARMEARASFSLSVPPLIRVTRLRVRERVSILLVTAHHLICDGWSIGILAREMGEIYAALREGRQPSLPALPVSYGDYAAWQRQWLADAPLGADMAFWKRSLEGSRHFEVAPDRPRPAVQTSNGRIASILLERELTTRLAGLARAQGCTMFVAAFATLLVLLHRYTGEVDVSVGTQVAGRNEVELEGLVGLFINTLVLRNDLSGDPSFLAFLTRVRDSVMDAVEHQQMPLEKLIEVINPKRDLSRNPLFSVNFIFQRSFIKNDSYGGLALTDLPSVSAGAMYDLNFFMVERPEGWRASCEFNTDLFDLATVEGMLGRWQALFRAVRADPNRKISALPILSEAERDALIHDWNRTEASYPQDSTLPRLFEAQVQRTPDAVAVVCGERVWSYRELETAANRLAQHLRRLDLAPGTLIGVFLDRSIDLVVSLLAILKSGSAYVPLDPSYPRERLAYIVKNSRLAALVTRSALRGQVDQVQLPTVLVDRDSKLIAQHSPLPPESAAAPEAPAYVIYTSGSTGLPKGVEVQHRALVNLLWAMRERPGLAAGDRLAAVTTISFDIAALEIFLPLIVGAKLIIAREDQVADGEALLQLIRREGATVLQATPATWQLLLDAGWCGDPRLKVLCGGDVMPRRLAERLLGAGNDVWNMYGPTETTVWSSAIRVESGQGPVPIGPPIANTQFYILDSAQELVAPGAPGELFIGGDGVALGYLGRPELTKERFLPDTFRNIPGARMYRTGDIVRMRHGRCLEYLGRTDRQIKLRGYRIELGEIEAVLLRHAEITGAAAVAVGEPSGEMAIRAYVAARPGASAEILSAAALALVRQYLPSYMRPSSIQVLRALPRTPNGKIDRHALPPTAQEPAPAESKQGRGDVEERLARVWESVLGIRDIKSTADFFDLGGNSLLAARLLARIKDEFGRNIALATLFKEPSIQGLATLLERGALRELDFRHVIKLRHNGSKTPLIAVNSTGIYHDLSKGLDADQPFTALQLFDPSCNPPVLPRSLEDIAADYVELILRVQPDGPYALLGWCVGCGLALEIAQQLRRSGRDVCLLVLVDGWVPGYLRRQSRRSAILAEYSYRWQLLMVSWNAVLSGQLSLSAFLTNRRIFRSVSRLMTRIAGSGQPGRAQVAEQLTAEAYDERLQIYLVEAARHYDPKPYAGRIMLFRSAEQPTRFLDHSLGWAAYATGGLEVLTLPGDHYSIFRGAAVAEMAARISAGLAVHTPGSIR